uniref:Serpin domain-containing protein n=1 Tax=Anopheles atroparvus TaxID=41427 RepID=A0AAG5CUY0_ANOAO
MSVPGFRKPAFATTSCCFLLILCASLCMSQFQPMEQTFYDPVSHTFYTVRNPQQSSYFGSDQQSKPYSQENLGQQSTAVGNSQQDQYRDFPQNGSPPRSLVTTGPSNVQDSRQQSSFKNPQSGTPSQNGDYFRGQSEQLKVQGNPRRSQDGPIYFPGMNYPQRDLESSQSTPGALSFAFSMLKAHVLPQQANSAICPILPQMLLASLYDVADQQAKSQLQTALQARSKELQLALDQQLLATNQSAANQLDFASTFFIGRDTKINPSFSNKAAQEGVTFQQVDFRNPNAAASVANSWVTDKTRGIIREIIAPSNLDPATRLMMASVIYFKGQWKFQFTKTEPAIFEPDPQTRKQVQMMYQYNKFRYGEIDFKGGNGLRWVDLPYEGSSELSMVLVLPKQRHQLQNSLQELSLDEMKEIMKEVTERQRGTNKVHLSVPRFSVFSSSSLVPALKSLGLTSIFDRSTALTSLANEELVVRDVSQRTYIAVDEKGTTATSVASLSFVALSAAPPPPTINFTLNEPFLAMIVDKKHAYPMFVAKVVTPEEIQS